MGRGNAAFWLALCLVGCDDGDSGFRPLPGADAAVIDAFALPDATPDAQRPVEDDFGDPCEDGLACRSGFCVSAGAGRVCSRRCGNDDDCPQGWLCRQVTNPEADVTFICVPEDAPCLGADLETDPAHCGACERACTYPAAEGRCVAGECALGPCAPGAHDLDGQPDNGCEYACTLTRGGEEACDAIDNDCDGETDEGFDLQTDPAHCGGCGRPCQPPNAEGRCEAGACALGPCAEGFVDLDGELANGCELGCRLSNDGVEACDGVDDDCDGRVDEDFDLDADVAHCGRCDAACALPNATSRCEGGQCRLSECAPGSYDLNGDGLDGCEYVCPLSNDGVEACDGLDNDCDGAIDEDFALDADLINCGRCGVECARPQAMVACVEGGCRFVGCLDGFHERDGDPETGCEYACVPRGPETCDGADDDCDGRVDEGFDLERDPAHCGRCGNACEAPNAISACGGGRCGLAACQMGFANPDGDPRNGCECAVAGAEQCNGLDDDCDGDVDEDAPVSVDPENCGACGRRCAVAQAEPRCLDGVCGVGRCLEGFGDADGDPQNGCECAVAGPERCNGADDDCDGAVDERFDLRSDVDHCGGCGEVCRPPAATPLCAAGRCRVDQCDPGFEDVDRDPANGCECRVQGDEVCDGEDDDCDGRVDEGFDLQGDVAHCGACGRRCGPPHAEPGCVAGACVVVRCAPGFLDVDDDAGNGCEVDCARDPDPACGGDIQHAGTYDLAQGVRYQCVDIIFGEIAFDLDVAALTFAVDGGVLTVRGLPTPLTQNPLPAGPAFDARGFVAGDCREDYILQGEFDDADTWSGVLRVEFSGPICGFTECQNQALPVTGVRR